MKTTGYNPSQIEVEFAYALSELKDQLQKNLSSNEIIKIDNKIKEDNPVLTFHLLDKDGDPHEVVIKIIQKPDTF